MASNKKEWLDWVKAFVIAGVLAFVVRMFFFTPIVVDGPSMLPTLENGDHMIVNKISYKFGEPQRFDIVIFHATPQKDYIKRVIGLPGEHVAVKNDVLYINNQQLVEPFLEESKARLTDRRYTVDFRLEQLSGGYETIPEGHVLVLGDNRGDSTDSRFLGLIPYEQLVGKAELLYWPLNRFHFVKD